MTDFDRLKNDSLVSIMVGVIGHLQIDDETAATQKLEELLSGVVKTFPGTPIQVMTSLAQGADLLAAEVATAMGLGVFAPIAMPQEHYLESTSFKTEDWKRRFKKIANNPQVSIHQIENPTVRVGDWQEVRSGQGDDARAIRHTLYAVAGTFLLEHCDFLIALWDEKPHDPKRPSGTAEQIAHQVEGIPLKLFPTSPGDEISYFHERCPAVVIPVNQQRRTPYWLTPTGIHHDAKAGTIAVPAREALLKERCDTVEFPEQLGPRRFSLRRFISDLDIKGAWKGLEDRFPCFLEFAKRDAPTPPPATTKVVPDPVKHELELLRDRCQSIHQHNLAVLARLEPMQAAFPPDNAAAKHEEAVSKERGDFSAIGDGLRPRTDRLVAIRRAASLVSMRYEALLERTQAAVFWLIFASLLFFHIYAHVTHTWPWLVPAVIALFGAIAITVIARRKRLVERRIDARVLAEALRVRLWWGLAGIDSKVTTAYDWQTRGEVGWIRQAIGNTCPPAAEWARDYGAIPLEAKRLRLKAVRDQWVVSQCGQHHKTSRKNHHGWAFYHHVGWLVAFLLGPVAMSVTLIVALEHDPETLTKAQKKTADLLITLTGMALVAGGLLFAFGEHQTYEELAHQYSRAHYLFRNSLREIDHWLTEPATEDSLDHVREIYKLLGHEALRENASWLILRRSKPVKVPVG